MLSVTLDTTVRFEMKLSWQLNAPEFSKIISHLNVWETCCVSALRDNTVVNPSALWHMGLRHGPGLRQLVASLSPPCRSGFNPNPAIYHNYGDWSDTGLAFSLSTLVFPCQYVSTNVPYSFIRHVCYMIFTVITSLVTHLTCSVVRGSAHYCCYVL